MDEGTPPEPEGSFVDYQTTMVKFSKAIAITAQEMVSALCTKLSMPGSMFFLHPHQSTVTILISSATETWICLCWWYMFSLLPDDEVSDLPWRAWCPCLSGDSGLWTASTPRTPCCSHCRARGGEKPYSLCYLLYVKNNIRFWKIYTLYKSG